MGRKRGSGRCPTRKGLGPGGREHIVLENLERTESCPRRWRDWVQEVRAKDGKFRSNLGCKPKGVIATMEK